jgi:putative membrane protein
VKRPGWLLALAGFALAAFLFVHEDPGTIAGLLASAGAGLVLAALCHVFSMILNARAWQVLMPSDSQPSLAAMTLAVWVRESVNGLLPVARIGGEIVSFRVLVRARVSSAIAAASLMVDMALSAMSQMAFALVGVLLLMRAGTNTGLALQITVGLAALVPLVAIFIAVQRGGIFTALAKMFDRLFAGRLSALIPDSQEADRAVNAMYARRGAIVSCFLWQCAGWVAGAAQIWVAAYFLGHPLSVLDAVAIEALIQAVSSAAFVIPGALGVQEGAFILAGAAVGLDAPASLALAASRRVRDLVIFFPGLAAWSLLERNRGPLNRDATS